MSHCLETSEPSHLPKMKTFKQFQEQIAPLKSNFVGPNLESLPHMDLRGPGQKLKSVMNQKKFYDSKLGRMQGGPPKGP